MEFELGAWFEGACGFALVLALSPMKEHALGTQSKVQGPKSKVQGPKSKVQGPKLGWGRSQDSAGQFELSDNLKEKAC